MINTYIYFFGFVFFGFAFVILSIYWAQTCSKNYVRRQSKTKAKTLTCPSFIPCDPTYEIKACSISNYLKITSFDENIFCLSPHHQFLHFMVPYELDFELKFDRVSGMIFFSRENISLFSVELKQVIGIQICFQLHNIETIPFEHNLVYQDKNEIKRKTMTVQAAPQWKVMESLSRFLNVPIYNCLMQQLEKYGNIDIQK